VIYNPRTATAGAASAAAAAVAAAADVTSWINDSSVYSTISDTLSCCDHRLPCCVTTQQRNATKRFLAIS